MSIKRGGFLISAAIALVGMSWATAAQAERIDRFSVQAHVTPERLLTIEETIDYNFEGASRHGIFRTLPERYQRSLFRYDLGYKINEVLMDGQPVIWEKTDQGADVEVKIGDPNALITGTHRYVIRYQTERAINDFSASHELYWNVTGNDWRVPVDHAVFQFRGLPVVRQRCFTGTVGSTEEACALRSNADGSITVEAPGTLMPGEGLTVALEFPLSAVRSEPLWRSVWFFLRDNFYAVFPLLLCLGMVGVWYVWGRDPRGRGVIIPQYEPPDGLTPGLMAGLRDQDISARAMSGTLLELARRGYAKIEFVGKEAGEPEKILYQKQIPPKEGALLPYEKEVLEGIFEGRTEVNLRLPSTDDQWKAYQKMIKAMTDEMVARGWFVKNPGAVRGTWMVIAFFIVVFCFTFGSLWYLPLAAVVGILGWYMPRMTPLAAELHERILGFRKFLMVTEKDRLAFSDAPAKRPEQFAEFLPAAVALGVEKEWAKQFEGMMVAPPSYMSGTGATWGSLAYVHALGHVSSSVASGMAHQSSGGSGGSGFSGGSSGGGFGGGGGGSW